MKSPFVLLALLALSGCASMSKNECLSADWYDIGHRDGVVGRDEDYLTHHAAACQRVAVVPDRERWREGHEQGLLRYCTVRSGFQLGEQGGQYSGVCQSYDEPEFLRGFDHGRHIYELRSRLNWLEGEIHKTHEDLRRNEHVDDDKHDGHDEHQGHDEHGSSHTDRNEIADAVLTLAQIRERAKEREQLTRHLRELEFQRGYIAHQLDDALLAARDL